MVKGWKNESRRHSLASRGVRTTFPKKQLSPRLMDIRERIEEKRPVNKIDTDKGFKTITEWEKPYLFVEKIDNELDRFRILEGRVAVMGGIFGKDPYGVNSSLVLNRQIGKNKDEVSTIRVYKSDIATFSNKEAATRYAMTEKRQIINMIKQLEI